MSVCDAINEVGGTSLLLCCLVVFPFIFVLDNSARLLHAVVHVHLILLVFYVRLCREIDFAFFLPPSMYRETTAKSSDVIRLVFCRRKTQSVCVSRQDYADRLRVLETAQIF